jgi:amino acid transporter
MTGKELVVNFFEVYLAAPIILVCGVVYKIWFRTRWIRVAEIDLVTGRKDSVEEVARLKEMDHAERMGWRWWRRVYDYLC